MNTWDDLKWWESGERQVIEENLYDLYSANPDSIAPPRGDYTPAFDACPLDTVKVAILGQDPYPTLGYATGIAFDIPDHLTAMPPTLINIFKEYSDDLGFPFPSTGSLLPWCKQGVFLWNVIPTCFTGRPASHRDWVEYEYLTKEIVDELSQRPDVLLVSLGSFSKRYIEHLHESRVYNLSHPSPLAFKRGNRPWSGSRFFSEVNRKLIQLGNSPVDWRLE